ncbi:Histidine ammonia-lyase [hydrothermal vent metagenome]|uniref:histidine ammonia-lyase n=1 Tax=hydrothermal vent metagenome TaxID=652676 RepID=A0A3B0VLA5_9ZZZZ
MEPLVISGQGLKIDDLVAVAEGRKVVLDTAVLPAINRSRQAVKTLVQEGRVAYGITTGFGRFKDKFINKDESLQLQLNLVRSHAAGTGPILPEKDVRAMLLARANTLAQGYSGVRPILIQTLLDMLNAGVHPRVPAQGSLGASGDLAPLAHLALPLIGEGEAYFNGTLLPGNEAMAAANITPLTLHAKEGLALLNGTAFMVGLGSLVVRRAINLALTADIAAALTLEALCGTDRAYDERVHQLRPHPRQIECAAFLRQILAGSSLLRPITSDNVQDPYTLRCVPQVHGAVRDSVAYAQWVLEIELNSVNDNPLIFADDAGNIDVISAGNFHGEPIALAMDYLKLALTEIGNMSERRIAQLVDANSNGGVLPMFLTKNGGLESGFMIAHYSAASLASENKVLVHPASADSIPSSANVEDHVSMGATAVRQAEMIMTHTETIVGIELLAAAQGIGFRLQESGGKLGKGTTAAYDLIRKHVPFLTADCYMSPLIEQVRQLVHDGAIKQTVELAIETRL